MISEKTYRTLAAQGLEDFEVLRGHPLYPDGTTLPALHERRFRLCQVYRKSEPEGSRDAYRH